MKHSVKEEIVGILIFVGVIWLMFIANWILPGDLNRWGLQPRTLSGTVGIVTAPFLHADWKHLLSNTPPLIILLSILAGSRSSSWLVVVQIVLLGGVLLWIFGRPSVHIGASGLVFGLISFLVAAGYFERRPQAMLIAVVVFFLYGTTFFFGILPSLGSHVSWEGHLLSGVAGVLVASTLAKDRFGKANSVTDVA
jgi:membrane associated rhomboid family serine protease